jgi:hypothetical protein
MGMNTLSAADIADIQNLGSSFEADLDLGDTFSAGFSEGISAGPTAMLHKALVGAMADPNLTGAEANSKYGLLGTEIEYKGDEMVSDVEADIASTRFFERKNNEAIMANIQSTHGFSSTATAFAGSLAAGFLDPINLATGVGTSLAMRKLGTFTAQAVFEQVVAGKVIATPLQGSTVALSGLSVLRQELAANFVASSVVDVGATKLGETVTRQKLSSEQLAFNVVASTLLGGAIGTVTQIPAIRQARIVSNNLLKQYGSQADMVIKKSMEHGTKNSANGKMPNPDYVAKGVELQNTLTRPGQIEHTHVELDADTIGATSFFRGKADMAEGFDSVSKRGTDSIEVIDNYNRTANGVSPIDGKTGGTVVEVSMEGKKIFTGPDIVEHRAALVDSLMQEKDLSQMKLHQIKDIVDQVDDVDSVIRGIHETIPNFKGTGSIDDSVNSAIQRLGFEGYHFVGDTSDGVDIYNGVVLFKGQDGSAPKLTELGETKVKFDPEHPDSPNMLQKLKDHDMEEAKRLASYESDVGFDGKVLAEFDRVKDSPEGYDALADIAADEGLDSLVEIEGLKGQAAKDVEALKGPTTHRDAMDFYMSCTGRK